MLRFYRPSLLIAAASLVLSFGIGLRGQLRADEAAAPPVSNNATDAQDGAASPTSVSAKKPPGNLWEMIVAGGPLNLAFMAVLGLISLAAAAAALERLANLQRGKLAPPALARGLDELVRAGDHRIERYQTLCEQSPSPLASVLRAALLRVGRPLTEIEKALEDAAAREMAELRARVRPLSVAANVAPMVGLLGTVVGMLEAFRVASQAGLGKAELLAEGIYLALETTVAGLLIAIPAMLCAAYFSGRNERLLREICDRMTEALPVLGQVNQRGTARPAAGNPLMES
ncbi:MAG TPA: MotA/TolQ/ExbB proton channel family protein [Pirellulales bacterium]|nr:MotA/TolQ/ExbB proton channel family protein [Pirellulales bacterium]